MKKIYIEASAGISGDMVVAALLDLGADEVVLESALSTIEAEGFKTKISRVKKSGLDCMDFDVILDKHHDGHDHDMEYLYGHLAEEHSHEHDGHHHDAEHEEQEHHEHHHSHEHRGINEINAILDQVAMTEGARRTAAQIFDVIAKAEAKVHGVPVEKVHFHEVGAIDSIVDVVAAAVCLDNLGVKEVIVPKLCEGQGTVRCQHGILPVPVPAVAEIASKNEIKLEILNTQGELVTPTGAAIVAATRTSDTLPKEFVIKKIGMGAGKRETGLSGILRIMEIQ